MFSLLQYGTFFYFPFKLHLKNTFLIISTTLLGRLPYQPWGIILSKIPSVQ
jgi:hypothetical protein